MSTVTTPTTTEKVKVTVNGILLDLKAGLDRKAIAEKYGLKMKEVKKIFQNPQLKGRKTAKEIEDGFELVDDFDGTVAPPTKATRVTEAPLSENNI
jgi:hypothetical protein